jgi:hypothetical protein
MKISRELVELLEREVDVKHLVDKLFFNIDDLEGAAIKQPKYYLEAGRFRSQAILRVSTLKRRLARINGEASLKIKHNRTGMTATELKYEVTSSRKVQEIQKKLDMAEGYYEFASQLTEAYKERLMVIGILSKIRVSEMSSELRHVQNEETVNAMRHRAKKARDHFEELEGNDI